MFKNKKFLVLLLCLVVLFAQAAPVLAVSFSDVNKQNRSAWAYDYIMELANEGIITGYEDGTFKPENDVSYLETLKLLYGIMDPSRTEINESLNKYKSFISEMDTPEWAYETVAVALNRGVVTQAEYRRANEKNLIQLGTDKPISRYDVAIFTGRALELSPKSPSNLTYKDKDDIHSAGAGLIAALIDTGVLHKDGRDGEFLPDSPIKRSEMAKMTKYAYDWVEDHPLTDSIKEQTEKGKVISYNPIGDKNYLVYENNYGSTVSALLDSTTDIKDKNDRVVKLDDVTNFIGAEVTVSYKEINKERHATKVVFNSEAKAEDGEYEFVSYRTVGNRYYITVEDKNGKKSEYESRYSTAKNGNASIFIQDIKPEAKLDLKFESNDLVNEVSLAKPQTGEYVVRDISTSGSYYSITVYPVDRGGETTFRLYSKSANVVKGTSAIKFTEIKSGDVVDLKFELQNLVNRIVVYPTSVVVDGSYTFQTAFSDKIYVKDNKNNKDENFDLDRNVKLTGFSSLNNLRRGDQIELVIDRYNTVTEIKLSKYGHDYGKDINKVKYKYENGTLYIYDIRTDRLVDHISGSKLDDIKLLEDGRSTSLYRIPREGYGYAKFNDGDYVVELDITDSYYNDYYKYKNSTEIGKVTRFENKGFYYDIVVEFLDGNIIHFDRVLPEDIDASRIYKNTYVEVEFDRNGELSYINRH